jgi:hypothetical protein
LTVPETEVDQNIQEQTTRNHQLLERYEQQMEAFTRLNYQVLMTLYATINNAAKAHISGLADAVQAFKKLKSLYE